MSPNEATMGQKADLDFMRVFGCNCFAHVPKEKRNKLDDTATKCKFPKLDGQGLFGWHQYMFQGGALPLCPEEVGYTSGRLDDPRN
jgi:hypothetical protein